MGGKMSREWHREYEREYRERPGVRAKQAAAQKRYREDPRLRPRHEARWKVNRAIKTGRLVKQPCEICGAPDVQAHHDDYSKPLDVRWLCIPCHAKARGES